MDELLREFVIESNENLETIDRDLMALEREASADVLASVFRAMHTIKGTAGFFDLPEVERLAHAAENLLGKLRDGTLQPTSTRVSALLRVADALRVHLASLEQTGAEAEVAADELIELLVSLCEDDGVTAPAVPPAAAPDRAADAAPQPSATERPQVSESSIRVDIGVLDELMTLVGELVLARNELVQSTSRIEDRALAACTQRINLITGDLRARVLKTRMRAVQTVWSAIPRLVRDTALACGKQVQVVMEGEDTELDKTVLEAIKDPLTHCVRNAVDHGIEPADVRIAAGKPAGGTLTLRASHENGNVVIEISDDGAGIDVGRVRAKALEQGLVSAAAVNEMSDRAVADLIFAPGFSTAAAVTNVSGRGVGMDVVRTNVERIGGTVDVASVAGHGCTFTISIPLTLAIIPALIVGCAGDRYAIPQQSVVEIVRVRDGREVEDMNGALVYRLRGLLLPLVDLRTQIGSPAEDHTRGAHIVVLRGAGSPFGLVVDAVHSTEEIVVKPLGSHYASIGVFAGATVMGDGRVALILDVANLADAARLSFADAGKATAAANDAADGSTTAQDGTAVLLVQVGLDQRLALPLGRVARLEKFSRREIERTGRRSVVQYRGDVLPVLSLDEHVGAHRDDDDDQVLVAVVAHGDREIGLSVARIVEVATARAVAHGDDSGAVRTAIVGGEVTDIVDLDSLFIGAGYDEPLKGSDPNTEGNEVAA